MSLENILDFLISKMVSVIGEFIFKKLFENGFSISILILLIFAVVIIVIQKKKLVIQKSELVIQKSESVTIKSELESLKGELESLKSELESLKSELKRIGIIKVYSDQESAEKEMLADFKESKNISVLAVKGDTFSNPDSPFNEEVRDKNKSSRYLISSKANRYLGLRGKELKMDLKAAVDFSISNFNALKKENNNIRLCLHKEATKIRIIMFDKFIYLSFHGEKMPGRESPVFRIRENSILRYVFSSQFEEQWKKYEEQ